jgi:hypothetical protein
MAKVDGLTEIATGVDRFDRPVYTVYAWHEDGFPMPDDTTSPTWSWATTFDTQTFPQTSSAISLPVNFGDVLLFAGHDRNGSTLEPGDTLELVLYWELLEKPARQYTIFAHLLDAVGQVVAGFDANEYPTSFWSEDGGERLLSYMSLPLARDLPPGEYKLEIGVYNQSSGERLPVLDQREEVADRLLLAPVTISE